jgi:hypothetical protein
MRDRPPGSSAVESRPKVYVCRPLYVDDTRTLGATWSCGPQLLATNRSMISLTNFTYQTATWGLGTLAIPTPPPLLHCRSLPTVTPLRTYSAPLATRVCGKTSIRLIAHPSPSARTASPSRTPWWFSCLFNKPLIALGLALTRSLDQVSQRFFNRSTNATLD